MPPRDMVQGHTGEVVRSNDFMGSSIKKTIENKITGFLPNMITSLSISETA